MVDNHKSQSIKETQAIDSNITPVASSDAEEGSQDTKPVVPVKKGRGRPPKGNILDHRAEENVSIVRSIFRELKKMMKGDKAFQATVAYELGPKDARSV